MRTRPMVRVVLPTLAAILATAAGCFPFDFDELRATACDAGANAPQDCRAPGSDSGAEQDGGEVGDDGGDADGGTPDGGEADGGDAGGSEEDGGDADAGLPDASVEDGGSASCPSAAGYDSGTVLGVYVAVASGDQRAAGAAKLGGCSLVAGIHDVDTAGSFSSTGRVLTVNAGLQNPTFVTASDGGTFLPSGVATVGATRVLAGTFSGDPLSYIPVTSGATAASFGTGPSTWSAEITSAGSAWANVRTISAHGSVTPAQYVVAGQYAGAPAAGGIFFPNPGGKPAFAMWLTPGSATPTHLATLGCATDPTTEVRIDRVEMDPGGGALIAGAQRATDGCSIDLGNGSQASIVATPGDYVSFVGRLHPSGTGQWMYPSMTIDPTHPALITRAPDGTLWSMATSPAGKPSLFHYADNGATLGSADFVSPGVYPLDLKVLSTGELVVVGYATGTSIEFGAQPVPVSNPPQGFLARFDADGGHQATHLYGGTADERIQAVVETAGAGLLLFGTVSGSAEFTPGAPVQTDESDIFVLRVAP